MSVFDPWTAKIEEARAQPNAHEPQGAFQQTATALGLKAKRERILSGDGFDVLKAVASCAVAHIVMPDWLEKAFLIRYRMVQQLKCDSWDNEKAFGKPYPKGMQLARTRRRRDNRISVMIAVSNEIKRDPSRPIDTEFWEQIGAEIGEGKSNAQKLHAEAVRMGFAITPSEQKQYLMSWR